jgi:hypothetical protein
MTLLVPWIVFPLVFGALSLGCGLLVQRAAGRELPGALLLPAGFSLIVVSASLTTLFAATAVATTPLLVVLALAGFALADSLRPRLDGWMIVAALGVFAVFAAPIVLSGSATFAGYITLDDTATWLALADEALARGREIASLPPSTFMAVMHDDIGTGYPLGAFLSLGIGHQLTGQDEAWIFQPLLAFLAVLISLSIYTMTSGLIANRGFRALTAFVGAQPALLFGYAFWSGIKEITVSSLVALLAALALSSGKPPWSPRATIPLAVGAAAVLDCLTAVGAVWFTGFIFFAALLVLAYGLRRAALSLGVLAGVGLVLALPALWITRAFLASATGSQVTEGGTLGNLIAPLNKLQIFGIWPAGDFRLAPKQLDVTYVLIGVLVLAALVGLVEALRQHWWSVPLYVVAAVSGCFAVNAFDWLGHGSPWLDAKALATASPAMLVAGLAGGAVMFERGRRVEALVVLSAIIAGVGWSNALQYGNVWLAPRGQLAELEWIGQHFSGEGPALMTEYNPYGVRHFLRTLEAEGASERRVRPIYLLSGGVLDKSQYADLDDFQLPSILVYRTLVLRTSPLESRPPSVYTLAWSGRWYEVWQRPLDPPTILEHLPLGTDAQPVGVPACSAIRQLASLAARSGGELVASQRAPAITVDLTQSQRPASWRASYGGSILAGSAGTATETVNVPTTGSYGVWLGGSERNELEISIDGHEVGATHELNNTAQLTPFGSIALSAGSHQIELHDDGPGLAPGSRGGQFAFGPLVLGQSAGSARLLDVRPAQAASLCGKSLDWVEAVAGS